MYIWLHGRGRAHAYPPGRNRSLCGVRRPLRPLLSDEDNRCANCERKIREENGEQVRAEPLIIVQCQIPRQDVASLDKLPGSRASHIRAAVKRYLDDDR